MLAEPPVKLMLALRARAPVLAWAVNAMSEVPVPAGVPTVNQLLSVLVADQPQTPAVTTPTLPADPV